MSQRKLMICVTECDGDVLADDSSFVRWVLYPFDFTAVERSLDLMFASAEKFVDDAYLVAEDDPNYALGGAPFGVSDVEE